MDKTVRKFTTLAAMKDDEYRGWAKLPASARLDVAAELSIAAYGLKDQSGNAPRLQRTLVHFQHKNVS